MTTHDYPGLGLPLRYHRRRDHSDPTIYPMGAHYNCWGAESLMLPVREVAMMIIMDRLMDKPDWHKKVFDDAIVAKWKQEALEMPQVQIDALYDEIVRNGMGAVEMDEEYEREQMMHGPQRPKKLMNEASFEFCVGELRHKAKYFESTGLIPTLDACATVVKSDSMVEPELHEALRAAFAKLKADQMSAPDWHPNTNEMVQDLVHPSMFPLVYSRSRVIKNELVGVEDAIDKWAGKGDVIPSQGEEPARNNPRQWFRNGHAALGVGGSRVPDSYWSTTYQWLPANVKFTADGVKLTSYINNLHPKKYPEIYRAIEKLIEVSLPAWDQCLRRLKSGCTLAAGRQGTRMVIDDPDDSNPDNWNPPNPSGIPADATLTPGQENWYRWIKDENERKWRALREPVQPDPLEGGWDQVSYGVEADQTLRALYNDAGLQVIVKMASIELTPDKPAFPAGNWHVEGQMNEHIVGTALYYLDSENVTSSKLRFRMMTSSYDETYSSKVDQDSYQWLEHVHGTRLNGAACLQGYGSVLTKQGRLLVFPNVFQHAVTPFELEDKTKPGHRRFIALWLVDPTTRIISTASVPPQQQEWWAESAFGVTAEQCRQAASNLSGEVVQLLNERKWGLQSKDKGVLPVEILNMVRLEIGEALPMTTEEAKGHREKLMAIRSAAQETAREGWKKEEYSFCEH